MKKILIYAVVIIGAGVLASMVLINNKKENQAKIEVVNQDGGAAPVKIAQVTRERVDMAYNSNGNFAPFRELLIKAESAGIVSRILVNEGDQVRQGQVLAVLDDKFLSLDQQAAEDAYNKLLVDKARYESSFKTDGVTKAQLDDIALQLRNAENRFKEAKRRSVDAYIKAPISGVIGKKYIETGAYLGAGTELFDIVDVSNLKLKVAVDESHVVQIKKGNKVSIDVPVFPDKSFSGVITFIGPKADEALNFPVEIQVANTPGSPVRAGMYATAVFGNNQVKEGLFVSRSAFAGSISNAEVYVLQQGNTVTLRKVVPGLVSGDRVEILEGLTEGEKVVVTGQINLSDGAAVVVQP